MLLVLAGGKIFKTGRYHQLYYDKDDHDPSISRRVFNPWMQVINASAMIIWKNDLNMKRTAIASL